MLGFRELIEKQIDRNKITYLAFIDIGEASKQRRSECNVPYHWLRRGRPRNS